MRILKSICKSPLGLASVFALSVLSAAPTTAQVMTGSGTVDAYTYSGSRSRQYDVYVPQSYNGTTAVPMVFALHGCAMDHDDVRNLWNFDLVADQNNVIIVFPFVTSFSESRNTNCWGYWFDTHVQEGRNGEVDDLHGIGVQVESNYNIDGDRRYITGLSSGGAMAVAAAISYNDYWAAAAPAEALAYGDGSASVTADQFNSLQFHVDKLNAELNYERAVPMLVIHSTNDTIVMPRGAELIRDSQLTVWGPDLNADGPTEDCSAEGISCTITTYNDADGNPLVKTMFYNGVTAQSATYGSGHYWSGDDESQALYAKDIGPSNSQHAWAFFETVTLQGFSVCEDPNDTTAPATPSNLSADDVHDKYALLSVNANSESDFKGYNIYHSGGAEAGFSSSASINVSGLNPESSYSLYAKSVDLCGNESSASNTVNFTTGSLEYIAPSADGTATEHYNAGRLDLDGYLFYGDKYGYIESFTLWQLQDGDWIDVDQNGTTNPTPTPVPGTPTPTPNPGTPTPTPNPATPTPTPAPGCEEVTSANYYHKTGGRATSSGPYFSPAYKANGSNDAMPGSTWGNNTLHSSDGSYWKLGGC